MEETFPLRSVPGLYNEDARVEVRSNTSTVNLRVLGDKKGEPSAWE
jgi:hypothetical protein